MPRGGGSKGWGESYQRAWTKQVMPMVRSSATSGAMDSPYSLRASRPMRNGWPVRGARTPSPEQSAKIFALTVWYDSVVSCQPVTLSMASPAICASRQEQLRSSVRLGWYWAFS